MRNKPIHKILALMFFGVTLIILPGCGDSDNPIVTEDTPTDDSTIPTGSLKGQVAGIEGYR
jgi:hypothetical protein